MSVSLCLASIARVPRVPSGVWMGRGAHHVREEVSLTAASQAIASAPLKARARSQVATSVVRNLSDLPAVIKISMKSKESLPAQGREEAEGGRGGKEEREGSERAREREEGMVGYGAKTDDVSLLLKSPAHIPSFTSTPLRSSRRPRHALTYCPVSRTTSSLTSSPAVSTPHTGSR